MRNIQKVRIRIQQFGIKPQMEKLFLLHILQKKIFGIKDMQMGMGISILKDMRFKKMKL